MDERRPVYEFATFTIRRWLKRAVMGTNASAPHKIAPVISAINCMSFLSSGVLAERVVEAIRKWKFRPGRLLGVPIAFKLEMEMKF